MNKVLLFFAIKYNGNWDAIYQALEDKEQIQWEDIKDVERGLICDYVTILDATYPEILKARHKPPFVIFYHGNLQLLDDKQILLSVYGNGDINNTQQQYIKEIIKTLLHQNIRIVTSTATTLNRNVLRWGLANQKPVICIAEDGLFRINDDEFYASLCETGLVISEYYQPRSVDEINTNDGARLVLLLVKNLFVPVIKDWTQAQTFVQSAFDSHLQIMCLANFEKNTYNERCIGMGAQPVSDAVDIKEILL